ncbi:MAG: hypothetical protein ABGX51_04605, partial [Gammaproteobacteria bacterium]
MAGEGGMVWIKRRDGLEKHVLVDTERGNTEFLSSDLDAAEFTDTIFPSFNSDGFTLASSGLINSTGDNYTSWTFRKAPRFFDVVTYTGNGVAGREIAHNLGVAPGMIIVKNLDQSDAWQVYHRGNTTNPETDYLVLDYGQDTVDNVNRWNDTAPTSSVFTLGNGAEVNTNTENYVAYLFAHDPVGANDDGMIACGSYTGNSSADGPEIDLGWEPQYIMTKAIDDPSHWNIIDVLRGISSSSTQILTADISNTESAHTPAQVQVMPTGFKIINAGGAYNSTFNFIYMAIRGPMMVEPESGTEVFAVAEQFDTATTTTGFPVDMFMNGLIAGNGRNFVVVDRLRGSNNSLETNNTSAESSSIVTATLDSNTSYKVGSFGANSSQLAFKRAKGFFDVVAWSGITGESQISHSLGVVPELIFQKKLSVASYWAVLDFEVNKYLLLNTNSAEGSVSYTAATDTTFNNFLSTQSNIAYLFATLAGVSKVGNYTGNGSSQNIACGFSAGARFVLIKRTDSTGDWYFWDTLRGIVAGNDPHLSLNTTAAEVTTDDSIDPQSAGFTVNQVTATNINVTSATY